MRPGLWRGRRWAPAVLGLLLWMAHASTPGSVRGEAVIPAERDCVAANNRDEIAQQFIGRCCRGSINSEFPEEWRYKTIGEIEKAKDQRVPRAHKAWKLLNKCEYKKG